MIRWLGVPPAEVERAVDPIMDRLLPFLPPWCRLLYIEWRTDSQTDLAAIDANETHHWGTLTIYPLFLDQEPDERVRTLAHEVAHMYFNRVDSVVEDMIEAFTTEGESDRILAEKTYERACEAVVEDLVSLFLRRE